MKRKPTAAELNRLYDIVRSYCRRYQRGVGVDDPQMVRDWQKICRVVADRVEEVG